MKEDLVPPSPFLERLSHRKIKVSPFPSHGIVNADVQSLSRVDYEAKSRAYGVLQGIGFNVANTIKYITKPDK